MSNTDMSRLLVTDETPELTGDARDVLDAKKGQHRVIFINRPQPIKYTSNVISTAKYNFLSFIPYFLFEQFRRCSNAIFLFMAIVQQIPDVSPTGRYATGVPLAFIILVSAIKEIVEDYKRHKADRETNYKDIEVMREGIWTTIKWKNIVVGDIVKVQNNISFPADLLVFSTSEPQGICYIETMNLDGETNLKVRQSLTQTSHLVEPVALSAFRGTVKCNMPNRILYDFTGVISRNGEQDISLSADRLLLRGAMLRNTGWIIGLVIYTGHDTKLMKNATSAPLKRSTIDKITNMQIFLIVVFLFSLCVISTACYMVWNNTHRETDWYLGLEDSGGFWGTMLFTILTFFLLYNNLIPISLQVTLEGVRFIQAIFINMDADMYHEESDTHASARTSNLNEELGMVKYIFSDKTGTLTCNIMEFRECSAAGKLYKEDDVEKLAKTLSRGNATAIVTQKFLTSLAVCHTVIPERQPNSEEIIYHASSPDERALLHGVKAYGFVFHTRTPDTIVINARGRPEVYTILNVLEFTSSRKRMSVIVRNPDSKIMLFCKGADSVIFERLSATGASYRDITTKQLEEFANSGLRTLCFAVVELTEHQYSDWNQLYHEAETTLVDRKKKMEDVANKIEKNMELLGATAVEDKLQDQVPDTIAALLEAGINLWVLTGDKTETAINIGYSTKLLVQGMPLIVLNETSLDEVRNSINNHLRNLGDMAGKPGNHVALVIDGTALQYALSNELSGDFLTLCISCQSVICCRVSPLQKAEVVELIRSNTDAVTLAIGDGANDVAMIQKAHVGIGISGMEGMQAAFASDYCIAQFRFLLKLLFVHGSWNHTRICKLILYSFYKNICLYVIEFWFAIYSAWSGQILFERWILGFYNVLFTAAPPIAIGIFDKPNSAEAMMFCPKLYSLKSNQFNVKIFWLWIANALAHSILLFWMPVLMVQHDLLWANGKTDGYLVLGNMVYTYVVVVVCIKAGLLTTSWNYMSFIAIVGSIPIWFSFFLIYSYLWPTVPIGEVMLGMDKMVLSTPLFWLGLILIPSIAVVTDLSIMATMNSCFVSEYDKQIEKFRSSKMNASSHSSSTVEKTHLLRNVIRSVSQSFRNEQSRSSFEMEMNHGFAFSQEEGGAVSQSSVVRAYDTNIRYKKRNHKLLYQLPEAKVLRYFYDKAPHMKLDPISLRKEWEKQFLSLLIKIRRHRHGIKLPVWLQLPRWIHFAIILTGSAFFLYYINFHPHITNR